MTRKEKIRRTANEARLWLALGEPDSLTFFLAVGTFFWGLWFIMPWNVFDSSTNFVLMDKSLLTEMAWGFVFMSSAVFKLWAWGRHFLSGLVDWFSVISIFVMTVLWGLVAATVITSNPESTGVVVYSMFFIASGWATAKRYSQLQVQNKMLKEGEEDGQ